MPTPWSLAIRPCTPWKAARTATARAATPLAASSTNTHDDYHLPVMLDECVDALLTNTDGVYADATAGGGGHSAAILQRLGPTATLFCADRDEEALRACEARLSQQCDRADRARLVRTNFGDLRRALSAAAGSNDQGEAMLDGLLLDLGVSSHQIDDPLRGFSFRFDGPLDMRMDRLDGTSSGAGTAAQIVNEYDGRAIASLLSEYGEERHARSIARAIVEARPLATTAELKAVVDAAKPKLHQPELQTKRLARVFQALRIEVNREMSELDAVLDAATALIKPGGRLVVLSYHSLEDRRVKRFLRSGSVSNADAPASDMYGNTAAPWRPLSRKAGIATDDEVQRNSRARSAKLRVGERTEMGLAEWHEGRRSDAR